MRRQSIWIGILLLSIPLAHAEEVQSGRRPQNDAELQSWLENMVWYHRFSLSEICAATGLAPESIEAALARWEIRPQTRPKRGDHDALLIQPYPGGRHPRIGFLEGAIDPQRETKVSIFLPWDQDGYVVADTPEAIWCQHGLLYLAHTHVPTMWTEKQVELPPLEWSVEKSGVLTSERTLPNGVSFGARVLPARDHVGFELWLKNGSSEALNDLRVQNCIMLKGAKGFTDQSNENKHFASPYTACHDADGRRWIISAWERCQRAWGNSQCPCLHSDPQFADCGPGQGDLLRGWLSFYEGEHIEDELARIESTGWRNP